MADDYGIGGRASKWLALGMLLGACGDDASEAMRAPDAAAHDAHVATVSDPTRVTLADGRLRGDVDGDSVRFLKVPFARPPVGSLRWSAPVPNDPWQGERHESDFGSACPQSPSQQTAGSLDEDCLYLNVWRPADGRSGAPVMVWIHGGGFTTGSAADFIPTLSEPRWYDGRHFAERHGVVVVTVNYRLGVFGFFAHPELPGEGAPLGNQGLLDQRRALEWVQQNIEAFGGDPDNVTIFGQSAGAGSVCLQMVSPGSRGLFHRAIGQSGACGGLSGGAAADVAEPVRQYAADHGCEGEDSLACLRGKPVTEFVSSEPIVRTSGFEELSRSLSFGSVVDGEGGFLPEPAGALIARGEIAQVPYILGTTFEEAQLYFLAAPVPETEEAYLAELRDTYGDFAERVLAVYPSSRFDGDYRKAMTRLSTDGTVCRIREHATRAVEAGLPVYLYDFNITWSIAAGALGPSHASEISHVFGAPYMDTEESVAVSDAMNRYWATFAATGDPNHDGAPLEWPRFMPAKAGGDLRMGFAPTPEILESFRKSECDLWREYDAMTE